MSAKELSPLERTRSSFKQLAASATHLNAASDELSAVVCALDQALKGLGLGISAWVKVSGDDDAQDGYHWSRDIGYSKVGNRWGIALRETSGNYNYPDDDDSESWLFADAPRWLRIESIGKIPDLLEHLVKQADSTTQRLKKKTVETKALADVINEIAAQTDAAAE
jgi:hypothetical protein